MKLASLSTAIECPLSLCHLHAQQHCTHRTHLGCVHHTPAATPPPLQPCLSLHGEALMTSTPAFKAICWSGHDAHRQHTHPLSPIHTVTLLPPLCWRQMLRHRSWIRFIVAVADCCVPEQLRAVHESRLSRSTCPSSNQGWAQHWQLGGDDDLRDLVAIIDPP